MLVIRMGLPDLPYKAMRKTSNTPFPTRPASRTADVLAYAAAQRNRANGSPESPYAPAVGQPAVGPDYIVDSRDGQGTRQKDINRGPVSDPGFKASLQTLAMGTHPTSGPIPVRDVDAGTTLFNGNEKNKAFMSMFLRGV
jgi:hypothetical protein